MPTCGFVVLIAYDGGARSRQVERMEASRIWEALMTLIPMPNLAACAGRVGSMDGALRFAEYCCEGFPHASFQTRR